jgi:hypothetical protein
MRIYPDNISGFVAIVSGSLPGFGALRQVTESD